MLPRALLIPHNADFEPGNSQLIGRANGAFSDRTGASWEKSEIRNPKEIRMTEISVWRKKRLSQQGCRRSRPAFKVNRRSGFLFHYPMNREPGILRSNVTSRTEFCRANSTR